ncbi:LysR substrate-binding domain-containing protein [Pelagimonas phthalicica]|nr:LysR substrate-binding domain-containing protein [Pelagimonas phthalicica]
MLMRRFLPSMSALQSFETAARHLNFSRAAEEMGITQSGISRQIKSLEDHLGMPLFDRVGPRLILTETGRAYAKEVSRVLDELESVSLDMVRGWKTDAALMVGAMPTVAARWLAPRLDRFSKRHPGTYLEVTPVTADTDLESSAVDIAILRGKNEWSNAVATPLFPERVAVVAAPGLIPRGTELAPERFVDFPLLQSSARPDGWLNWIAAKGVDFKGRIQGPRFGHVNMLANAAISGLGLAIVPTFLIEPDLERGDLHLPFGPSVLSGETYFAVSPERKAQYKSVLAFRDWLHSETKSLRQAALD